MDVRKSSLDAPTERLDVCRESLDAPATSLDVCRGWLDAPTPRLDVCWGWLDAPAKRRDVCGGLAGCLRGWPGCLSVPKGWLERSPSPHFSQSGKKRYSLFDSEW